MGDFLLNAHVQTYVFTCQAHPQLRQHETVRRISNRTKYVHTSHGVGSFLPSCLIKIYCSKDKCVAQYWLFPGCLPDVISHKACICSF